MRLHADSRIWKIPPIDRMIAEDEAHRLLGVRQNYEREEPSPLIRELEAEREDSLLIAYLLARGYKVEA